MIITKRLWIRLIFVGELICFFGFYFFGAQGLVALHIRKKEFYAACSEKETLQGLIKGLESSLSEWTTEKFFKEKMAREQLHMARPGELVYVIE